MKPTLASLFPGASQECHNRNPQLSLAKAKKTPSTATRDAIRAILNHDETPNQRQISSTKSQPNKTPALGATVQGKTESVQRVTVRFIGYRVRPLDPDNFAGSCKDLLDGLRHAGLISDDSPWQIKLETEQVCVRSYAQEVTVIEIEYP